MENAPIAPNERQLIPQNNICLYSGDQTLSVCTPVEYSTALTSISTGAFAEFCEIKLAIFLDFEDSVFDLERIDSRDRFGMNIENDVHLIGMFFGGT